MVSTRRLLGKLSQREAVKLIFGREAGGALSTRIGRHVMKDSTSESVRSAPNPDRARAAVEYWNALIEKESEKKQTPSRIERIRRSNEALKLLRGIGQKRVTAFQLAAVMALQHGLDSRVLSEHIAPLYSIEVSNRGGMFWDGTMNGIRDSLKHDLPARIERVLYEEKRILDTDELIERLNSESAKARTEAISQLRHESLPTEGPEAELRIREILKEKKMLPISDSRARAKVNIALGLLDQLGLAIKNPMHSKAESGGMPNTYSHAAHGALPIRHPNAGLEILEKAYAAGEEGVDVVSLHLPTPTTGTSDALRSSAVIGERSRALEKRGLIRISKTRGQSGPRTRFHLTEAGTEFVGSGKAGTLKEADAIILNAASAAGAEGAPMVSLHTPTGSYGNPDARFTSVTVQLAFKNLRALGLMKKNRATREATAKYLLTEEGRKFMERFIQTSRKATGSDTDRISTPEIRAALLGAKV